MNNEPTSQTTPELNLLQLDELRRVQGGKGHYLPSSRQLASVKALANRRLVELDPGIGWKLLPLGHNVLVAYEND